MMFMKSSSSWETCIELHLFSPNTRHEKIRVKVFLKNFQNSIKPDEFKQKLELYLKDRQSTEFLTLDLVNYLMKTKEDQRTTGVKWNTLVINAVVIFVGEQAITQILGKVVIVALKIISNSSFSNKLQIPTPLLTIPLWTFIRLDNSAF